MKRRPIVRQKYSLATTRPFLTLFFCVGFGLVPLTIVAGAGAESDRVGKDLPPATESDRDFHVSTDGDDAGPGTAKEPFRSIQHAADVTKPGDTVWIHGGTYRESVTVKQGGIEGNPIVFRAAPGELVEIRGADPVETTWTRHDEGIFKTHEPRPVRQLFLDRKALNEARWPNARPDQLLDRSLWAHADRGSRYGRVVDPRLAEAGINATGAVAMLNVAHQFFTWTRSVEEHSAGSDTFHYAEDLQGITHFADKTKPWEDDRYFLFGKLELLDEPGEWFHDAAADTLYLWPPAGDDPSTRKIEIKSRDYGFVIEQCEHVQVVGLHFFGCTMALWDCNRCRATDCHFLYPNFARRIAEQDGREEEVVTEIRGDENRVDWCSFAHGPTSGLRVTGRGNLLDNILLHDFCHYGDLRHPGLALQGVERDREVAPNRVRHGTLRRCGNAIVNYRGPGHVLEYNHVHDGGLACKDVALVYTGQPSTAGNIVRYNWVHGCHTEAVHRGGLRGGLGIRGDDQTRGLTVHHNVVWDCGRDGIIVKGDFNRVLHNTVFDIGSADKPGNYINLHTDAEPEKWWRNQFPLLQVQNRHGLVANNAALTIAEHNRGSPYPFQENLVTNCQAKDLELVDPDRFDFRPRADSPLVAAGTPIQGLDEPVRSAAKAAGLPVPLPSIVDRQTAERDAVPDVGAYRHAVEPWIAGHRNAIWFRETENEPTTVCLRMPVRETLTLAISGREHVFTSNNWMIPRKVSLEPGREFVVDIPHATVFAEEVHPGGGKTIPFTRLLGASD